MYDLQSIIAQNQRAEALGLIKPGSAVGTTGFVPHNEREVANPAWAVSGQEVKGHREDNDGLRGHSVGENYPFSVVGGFRVDGDVSVTTWTVVNYATGQEFETYYGLPFDGKGCENAHNRASVLKRQSLRNPEY